MELRGRGRGRVAAGAPGHSVRESPSGWGCCRPATGPAAELAVGEVACINEGPKQPPWFSSSPSRMDSAGVAAPPWLARETEVAPVAVAVAVAVAPSSSESSVAVGMMSRLVPGDVKSGCCDKGRCGEETARVASPSCCSCG